VIPEHGLLSEQMEIILGMHFSHAVATIQSLVGSIKGVQILYSDKDPLKIDLVINLTLDGIKLIFDPINQRLKTIEVHDMTCLKLKYSDVVFNCPEVSPTIEQIDQTFGATHPGVYDEEKQVFTLTFRGLSFEFPAETQFQPRYGGIRQELGRLQFPPGESPRVSKMYIYTHGMGHGGSVSSGTSGLSGQLSSGGPAESVAPPLPPHRYPCVHHLGVEVIRRNRVTMGLRVRLVSTPSPASRSGSLDCSPTVTSQNDVSEVGCGDVAADENTVTRTVLFGDSVQDVVTAVGAPARIFYKDEDKMKIHSPNAHRKAAALKSDYFYNYFTLGFDILFDARTNCVKKFILHTNYPGHYNFNMYHRCMFDLPLQPGGQSSVSLDSVSALSLVSISPFSRWDEIAEKVKPSERPVVLNRSSSTNTTNPFGSTFCYGYQDIIFEVMPNFHIASVTLYSTPNSNSHHHTHGASHPYGLVNNYLNMKGGGGGGGGGKSQNINLVCNKLQQQTLNDPASDNFDLESDLVSS